MRQILRAAITALLLAAGHAVAAEPSHQQFEQSIKATAAPLAGKSLAALKVLYLSADVGPWMDTGLALAPGETITMVLNGKVWLSRTYNLSFNAPIAVWAKVGDAGAIFRGETDTNTFTVGETGTLRLKTYPGQRWTDPSGRYVGDPVPLNPDAGGGVSVAVLKWAPDANVPDLLQNIARQDPTATWAVAEVERRRTPARVVPAGWRYLWELGPSGMFAEDRSPAGAGAPARAIDLHTQDSVGILQKDVSLDLTPGTTLRWKWKADKLPAATAENTLPTHDYMSIAVEFDNGRDLTYFWSSALPVGQSFHCPLPGWDHRETHIVARSGTADMGRWLAEEKNLQDAYARAVGGAMPKRITRIWLIGVSLFQHGEGASQFGEIVLRDGGREVRVF